MVCDRERSHLRKQNQCDADPVRPLGVSRWRKHYVTAPSLTAFESAAQPVRSLIHAPNLAVLQRSPEGQKLSAIDIQEFKWYPLASVVSHKFVA